VIARIESSVRALDERVKGRVDLFCGTTCFLERTTYVSLVIVEVRETDRFETVRRLWDVIRSLLSEITECSAQSA